MREECSSTDEVNEVQIRGSYFLFLSVIHVLPFTSPNITTVEGERSRRGFTQ